MDQNRWNDLLSAMSGGPPRPDKKSDRPVVLYQTRWKNPADGWNIASRGYARAMDLAGLDVRLVDWHSVSGPLHPEVDEEVGRLNKPAWKWDVQLFSGAVGSAELMRETIKNLRETEGPKAYQAVFERQYVEPELAKDLNSLDGVHVQCASNRDVLLRAGADNVTLIHFPYFDDDPHLQLGTPQSSSRFYWIGRFEPRKAPENLIRAFMRAFRPGEATLTMKVSKDKLHPDATPEGVITTELGCNGWTESNWRQGIRIIQGRLSKAEMVQLHADHDIYVSASRGEGLDLPSYAAKLAGRRLVLTDSGAPKDFMNEGDILVPATKQIPVVNDYYWWGPGATYNDYDLDEFIVAMQTARQNVVPGSRVPNSFRAENIGKKLAEWIDDLCSRSSRS